MVAEAVKLLLLSLKPPTTSPNDDGAHRLLVTAVHEVASRARLSGLISMCGHRLTGPIDRLCLPSTEPAPYPLNEPWMASKLFKLDIRPPRQRPVWVLGLFPPAVDRSSKFGYDIPDVAGPGEMGETTRKRDEMNARASSSSSRTPPLDSNQRTECHTSSLCAATG